jgi:signal transduction histidine kinase/FixJ family two-component response regulator
MTLRVETRDKTPANGRTESPLQRWLRTNSVLIAGVLITAGFAALMWKQMSLCESLITDNAVLDAARLNNAVAQFRTLYSSEVLARAQVAGVHVSHDYQEHAGAISPPATLSMMLVNRLRDTEGGVKSRLYSDFSFPWRKDGGALDDFERDALPALRANPQTPFVRFETISGEPVIRYATADLMRPSCVNCHNTHPDTPKSDWKLGDVRGVLAVTVPMKSAVARTHAAVQTQFYALAGCGGLVLCVFALAAVRLKRHSDSVEAALHTLSGKQRELAAEREKSDEARRHLQVKADQLDGSRRAALNLMADMAAARDAANAASVAKSNFLANMSHEIRTPMTAIIGFGELLTDRDTSEEDRLRAAETVTRNGQHLLALINDILDLSKIEAGHMEVERLHVNPRKLLDDVQELLSVRSEEKGLSLRVSAANDVPELIVSDPLRLKQALVNLTGNAIKFTESGSVDLLMTCYLSAQTVAFHIIDTGVGMTVAQSKRIFEPFCQADTSMTRRFGGTGLGLTITRQIAQLLGGDLTVTSEPGKGSTFSMTVASGNLTNASTVTSTTAASAQATSTNEHEPTHPKIPDSTIPDSTISTDETPQRERSSRAATTPKLDGRILVVEDGPDNQRLISFLLRKAGAEVDVAGNGRLGVIAAQAARDAGRSYELILMDMQMPVMDGYTATRELRDSGWTGPIVALTAHALSDEIKRCLSAGCDGYLRKPIEKAAFFAAVRQRLDESRLALKNESQSLSQVDSVPAGGSLPNSEL